ncbi:MAG: flagellar hook-length control protein FliK [Bradyrhizobium sp.]|uniref:flagellar hook-length control protein FliK n=1 Tax=Bradyrhizobium sp. TaxID=376 RepID=UPI001D501906|nr:flagellar hook-length control protein FliK [Bradyrhizobium sp.]MBV9564888.1 flagellar hook-length control protein FliK [Bradyrhizobium sp.]
MALTVNPSLPIIPAQGVGGAASGLVLQPGAVVSAEVLKVADNLVQIAIANLSIDVLSEIPLQVGQQLQLAVSQTPTGFRLAVVGQGAGAATADTAGLATSLSANTAANVASAIVPDNDPLTPPQRVAISAASEDAAAHQQSLAPLFADLNAVAASDRLPQPLQRAVLQVLAQQTPLDAGLTGGDIQNAFQRSGLLLEASLASGSALPSTGVPDLKAALIVLRQALLATVAAGEDSPAPSVATLTPASSSRPAVAAASPVLAPTLAVEDALSDAVSPQPRSPLAGQDAPTNPGALLLNEALSNTEPKAATTGAVLTLMQEALQRLPRVPGNVATLTVALPDGRSAETAVHTTTPPPPLRGGLPVAQPIELSALPPDAPLGTIVHRLLDDTDAALARQTLLQVASLPDRADPAMPNPADANAPRWNFEIPFATAQGTAMAQFEISRDGGGGNELKAAKQVWRARFSLDVEPAGPVHALITLSGERTSVRMWAERPATAAQLRAGASELSQALSAAALQPGDIVIRDGMPPQPAPTRAGHFLDRAL